MSLIILKAVANINSLRKSLKHHFKLHLITHQRFQTQTFLSHLTILSTIMAFFAYSFKTFRHDNPTLSSTIKKEKWFLNIYSLLFLSIVLFLFLNKHIIYTQWKFLFCLSRTQREKKYTENLVSFLLISLLNKYVHYALSSAVITCKSKILYIWKNRN